MAGMAGFTIRLALSELGPLTVFLSASLPDAAILLDPDTGLTINNFAGGVEFFKTLPSIDDPIALRGAAFAGAGERRPSTSGSRPSSSRSSRRPRRSWPNPARAAGPPRSRSPMTITGSATIYSIYTSQQLFNGQVTVEISTDGKILIIGTLNFADNNLSISGRLYADLSQISLGRGDGALPRRRPRPGPRPDALRASCRWASRTPPATTSRSRCPDLPPASPTATLAGPRDGGTISPGELNGRGYIDVSFAVPTGEPLDDSSITDLAPEFTISASSGADHARHDAGAGADRRARTYRYWTTGALQAGDSVVLHFVDNKWQYFDSSGNATPNSGQADFTLPSTATIGRHYIDVNLTPSGSNTVNAATVDGGEICARRLRHHRPHLERREADEYQRQHLPLLRDRDVHAARSRARHLHRRHVAGLFRGVERRLERDLHDHRAVGIRLRAVHGRQRRCRRREQRP